MCKLSEMTKKELDIKPKNVKHGHAAHEIGEAIKDIVKKSEPGIPKRMCKH
jgi:hypothetical protein